MLHFVIATKQPSMTAATLAAAISQAGGRLRDTERIVDLLAATLRSQLAAIAGNVLVALPVAVLVGLALAQQAPPPVSAAKAARLLAELDALRSPLVAHAAIAGVWLKRPEGSNWGDFGEDDQIGRMNLVTPTRRLAAVKRVTEGLAFQLGLPLDHPKKQVFAGRNPPVLSPTISADG